MIFDAVITSRAVVGSSAMTRRGLSARAIAIIARCFIPPLYSCGKLSIRSAGMPTRRYSSSTRVLAASGPTSSCVRIVSVI